MKRGNKLIALLAVLVLLVGATVLITQLNPKEDAQQDTYTTVFSLDPDKVTNISWEYSKKASFTRTEDGWVYDEDAAFPVDVNCLDDMLRILSSVGAKKTIANV